MTQEEVVFMLAEAIDQDREYKSWHVSTKHLMTLAKMVAEKEREACAKIADEWSGHFQANEIAKAIRERNND